MRRITVTLVALLVTTLLMIQVTADSYDPWLDLNDDGEIDIFDIVKVAGAYGTTGTPINKTELLLELLDRVDSNEQKLDQIKWIRFYEPNQTENNQTEVADGAIFYWNPDNISNNAILQVHCYFKYRTESIGGISFRIDLNGVTHDLVPLPHKSQFYQSTVFTYINNPDIGLARVIPPPNQDNYTITFQFVSGAPVFSAYVKDINILIEVMDGLPAS